MSLSPSTVRFNDNSNLVFKLHPAHSIESLLYLISINPEQNAFTEYNGIRYENDKTIISLRNYHLVECDNGTDVVEDDNFDMEVTIDGRPSTQKMLECITTALSAHPEIQCDSEALLRMLQAATIEGFWKIRHRITGAHSIEFINDEMVVHSSPLYNKFGMDSLSTLTINPFDKRFNEATIYYLERRQYPCGEYTVEQYSKDLRSNMVHEALIQYANAQRPRYDRLSQLYTLLGV